MLDYAFRLGREARVNVHVQVRATHDVSQAILETIDQRHVDLVLMEATSTPVGDLLGTTSLGNVAQRLGQKAPCELAILRWSPTILTQLERRPNPFHRPDLSVDDPALLEILQQLRQWVVFLGGGPNAKCALRLLPGLTSLERSSGIHLCHIESKLQRNPLNPKSLEAAHRYLRHHTSIPITFGQVQGDNVLSTMLEVEEAQHASVLILGISQDNFMKQAIRGNLPEQVAAQSDRTIILTRDALHNLQ